MMRITTALPVLVIGIALSGCMGSTPASSNRSLESVHQPVVSVDNYVFDADISGGAMSAGEQRRLADWLDAMDLRYGDRVAIDESQALASRGARDAVAMLVARRGMLMADFAPATQGAVSPGRMRVVLTRAAARVDGCPDWGTRSSTGTSNTTTSNYGCATNANLAAMVADANDLVRGQARTGNDPNLASKAIQTYRAAPPTGANGLSTQSTQSGGGGQ